MIFEGIFCELYDDIRNKIEYFKPTNHYRVVLEFCPQLLLQFLSKNIEEQKKSLEMFNPTQTM